MALRVTCLGGEGGKSGKSACYPREALHDGERVNLNSIPSRATSPHPRGIGTHRESDPGKRRRLDVLQHHWQEPVVQDLSRGINTTVNL